MKKIVRYKELVMTLGLFPALICTLGSIYLPDTYVIYTTSLLSLFYFLYDYNKNKNSYSRLILFYTTLALLTCAVIKLTNMDWLLPEHSTPITLEVLLFCFAISFIFFPKFYQRISSTFYPNDSILNRWACQSIIAACTIHFLLAASIELISNAASEKIIKTMIIIAPTFFILLSILLNYLTIILLGENIKKSVTIRIAPICNGKIYISPTNTSLEEEPLLDLPISEFQSIKMKEVNKCAEKLCMKYQEELSNNISPRFSLSYINKENSKENTILLYILPIESEDKINFKEGFFIEPKKILNNQAKYSPILVEEAGHLQRTVEMWKLFG